MTKYYTYILSLFISQIIYCQNNEFVAIDSETKDTIRDSYVVFLDLNLELLPNKKGVMLLDSNISFPQEIEVSAFGYKSKLVTLEKNTNIIELEELHYQLNEVVVSVPSGKIQRQHITNVESRKIKNLNYIPSTNLIQQISNIPGVENFGNGAGISKPTIRGLNGSRIVTLLNGLRIENQQWGNDHGTGVSSIGIKNVEVIKGPTSLLYGSDALGGVLYFADDDYSLKPKGFVKTSFESNNLGIKNEGGIKFSKKNIRVNIFGSMDSQADYKIPSGDIVKNSRFRNYNFKTSLGYQKKNYNLNIRYNYLNGRIGIPGHTHNPNASLKDYITNSQNRYSSIPAQVINNHYILLDNKFYIKDKTLSLKIGNVTNRLQEFDEKVTFPAIDLLLNTTNYNTNINIPLNNSYIIFGSQGMLQNNINNNSSEQIIPNYTTIESGIYSIYNKNFNKTDIQTGIRYDYKTLKVNKEFKGTNTGTTNEFNSVNYSVGMSRKHKNNIYRLNISSGYRAPNSSELYSNGIHHGAIRYELGNANLKPEHATQLDLSWEVNNEHLSFVINPYYNIINNYIYISPLDSIIDNKRVFEYYQTRNTLLFGGEIGIHYHPHFAHNLHLETNFSYTEGRISKNNYLPLIPQPKLNTLLKLEGNNKGKLYLNNVSLQHLYFLPQNKLSLNEIYSVDYHIINIGVNLGLNLNMKNKSEINLGVRNVLNTDYINHLSQLKYLGINNPGRNFYLGIIINI